MRYDEWLKQHTLKKEAIIAKLDGKDVIKYFEYENMRIFESDFCPLYQTNTKCHDIENLNCFGCDCKYFGFDDNANKSSWCNINSPFGKAIEIAGKIHQDCTMCTIPHKT